MTATALLVGLIDVLVDRVVSDFSIVADVPDDRTIVDVAVAWTTVRVMVVVEASDSVVSCAKTEGVRMKASVASVIAKRIFKESIEDWICRVIAIPRALRCARTRPDPAQTSGLSFDCVRCKKRV